MRGVCARYDAALPPNISIVRHPGRPIIAGMDLKKCRSPGQEKCRKSASESAGPKRVPGEVPKKVLRPPVSYTTSA